MDGLMLDTEPLYKSAWQRAALPLGFVLDEAFYFTLIGRTNASAEIALMERFGSNFPMAVFRERWAALWREDAESGIELKPGLLELLEYLEERKIPAAVATSSDREYAAFSLRAARLDIARFAHVVTSRLKTGSLRPTSIWKPRAAWALVQRVVLPLRIPMPE